MALIICPECNKEISNKSDTCIHCGHPLVNYICNINGIEYNLKNELSMSLVQNEDWIKAIGSLRRKTNLTLVDGKDLIEIIRTTKKIPTTFTPKYALQNRNEVIENNVNKVECPYCHSKNTKKISAISKMWSLNWLGMYGIGKVSKQWHCNNCDSDF